MRSIFPPWARGHAPIRWRFEPCIEAELIRDENSRSDDLQGWFPLALRWRTRSLRPRRSDDWVLELSPEAMRLMHTVSGRNTVVCEIGRLEAGELEIEAVKYKGVLLLSMVAGRSVDGLANFILHERTVSSGGFMGLFDRVSVGCAVVSWWPVNARSRDGLSAFEHVSASYWNPSGLSVGSRVTEEVD
jgi:hypothetical protein